MEGTKSVGRHCHLGREGSVRRIPPSQETLPQGFYFEGRFNYEGRLFLTAGFRQEINSEFQNKATHKLEVVYQFKESETKFRVSHATGFCVPSQTDDLFTPLINPSESRRDEISSGFTG